jgi:hypothetical protein
VLVRYPAKGREGATNTLLRRLPEEPEAVFDSIKRWSNERSDIIDGTLVYDIVVVLPPPARSSGAGSGFSGRSSSNAQGGHGDVQFERVGTGGAWQRWWCFCWPLIALSEGTFLQTMKIMCLKACSESGLQNVLSSLATQALRSCTLCEGPWGSRWWSSSEAEIFGTLDSRAAGCYRRTRRPTTT